MGIGYRIKEARENLGFTQAELGKMIGVTGSAITNYENETSHPKEPIMYKLIEALKVDANYLFQDCVQLPKEANDVTLAEYEHIKKYRFISTHSPDGASVVDTVLDREYAIADKLRELDGRIKVLEVQPAESIEIHPLLSPFERFADYYRSASAGDGIFILGSESTAKIAMSEADWNDKADYAISISGTSMEPDYNDGDTVLVSQRVQIQHGDVGIFVVDGKAYIKEYGEKELISRNPQAENIKISEYSNIVCMGKVVGKVKGEYRIIND